MGLLTEASVAIDGSKFKAVNNRDKNFTRAKMERRMAQIEECRPLPTAARNRRPAGAVMPSRGGSASAVPRSGVLTSRLGRPYSDADLIHGRRIGPKTWFRWKVP
jgi:hypothetical protein